MSLRDKFIFNSDYPVDKIVWLKEGELTMNAWGSTGDNPIQIAHDIGVQIFVNGVWTIDNWTTTYNFNAERTDQQGYVYQSFMSATTSKVYFNAMHASGANKKFKYRLWAFMNENATKGVDVKPTAGWSSNRLVFSTDYDYPMLYKEGITDPNAIITHGLGEIPYVDIWGRGSYDNYGYRMMSGDSFGRINDTGDLVRVTTQSIIFRGDSSLYNKYYYRIYLP